LYVLETQIAGAVPLSFFFNLSTQCSGYYIHAIGHTLGFSHTHTHTHRNVQDELQFAILANLKMT